MPEVIIQSVPVDVVRPLRSAILRPGLPMEHNIYPLDDNAESLHVGAFEDGRLVGTATILHEPPAGSSDPKVWRLRGVTTLPEVRGKRYGVRILHKCIAYVAQQGGTMLWCKARTDACGFYEKLGFTASGDETQDAISGPHFYMSRVITPEDVNIEK